MRWDNVEAQETMIAVTGELLESVHVLAKPPRDSDAGRKLDNERDIETKIECGFSERHREDKRPRQRDARRDRGFLERPRARRGEERRRRGGRGHICTAVWRKFAG